MIALLRITIEGITTSSHNSGFRYCSSKQFGQNVSRDQKILECSLKAIYSSTLTADSRWHHSINWFRKIFN